jgi:ATP/ADP translocase
LGYLAVPALVLLVSRRVRRQPGVAHGVIAQSGRSRLSDALAGFRVVVSSRYFLGICVILGSYELVSAVNDFCFHKAVELSFKAEGGALSLLGTALATFDRVTGLELTAALDRLGWNVTGGSMGSFFSGFFLAMNLVALAVQVLLTSFVLRRAGMTVALLVLPVAIVSLSTGFFALPVLALVELLFLADNSLNYSMNQTSRELLFVPVRREDKYRALAFIDMFVLRAAKATAGFLLLLLPFVLQAFSGVGLDAADISSLRWYMLLTVPLGIVWSIVAVLLGSAFRRKTAPAPAEADEVRADVQPGAPMEGTE